MSPSKTATTVSNGSTVAQPLKLANSEADMGRSIEMFSFRTNRWDRVDIIDYEPLKRLHKCLFLDGSCQWLDLSKKPVRDMVNL